MMEKGYLGQFLNIYPPSMDVLAAVLKNFETKQELEDEWIGENTPHFRVKLVKQLDLDFVPLVLVRIIAEYATVTWFSIPSRAQWSLHINHRSLRLVCSGSTRPRYNAGNGLPFQKANRAHHRVDKFG